MASASPPTSGLLLANLARVVVVLGAGASVVLLFRVAQHNNSALLISLFVVWVLSPFVGFLVASASAKHFPRGATAALHWLMLIMTVAAVGLYAKIAFSPPSKTPAAMFLFTPLGSWVLIGVAFRQASRCRNIKPVVR